ncbi:ABC transporter ATP-binding protein [Vibrio cholerae]|nr:ABC transporter ATP-binding protein [Vibrio cholerae]
MSNQSILQFDSLKNTLQSLGKAQLSAYLVNMLVWTIIHGLPLLTGYAIAQILSRAEFVAQDTSVWLFMWLAIGSMLARSGLLYLGLNLDFTFIFKTSAAIKLHLVKMLGLTTNNKISNGDMLNRIREDSDEISNFLGWTADFVFRTSLLLFAVGVLLSIEPIATIALLPMIGGLAVGRYLKSKVSSTQTTVRQQSGQIANSVIDTLTGIRDLRLGGGIDARLASLSEALKVRRTQQAKHQMYMDLLSSLYRNMIVFGTVIVLTAVSYRFATGEFTVASLILFLTYVGWIGEQIFFFGRALANYKNAQVSLERIKPIANQSSNEGTSILPFLDSLSIQTEWKLADNPPSDISLNRGEVCVITGDNGTGKSRFVRELLNIEGRFKGAIRWNDKPIECDANWAKSPNVSFAHQGASFYSGTVRDNLQMAKEGITENEMNRVLHAVQLIPGSDDLPDGLDTVVGSSSASGLSGGQRHRLAIARMLCAPAQLYIVDECDSSLDHKTAAALWGNVVTNWPGIWIIVSRNSDLIQRATSVVRLKKRDI